jgi:hypothetical protein
LLPFYFKLHKMLENIIYLQTLVLHFHLLEHNSIILNLDHILWNLDFLANNVLK